MIKGAPPNLAGFMTRVPCCKLKRSDLTSSKSEQVFTGKNLDLGTTTPWALLKYLIAAPTAVSNCMTLISELPMVIDFWFGMISICRELDSTNLLMALKSIHKLFVLKFLNFLIDLNSSTWSFGT